MPTTKAATIGAGGSDDNGSCCVLLLLLLLLLLALLPVVCHGHCSAGAAGAGSACMGYWCWLVLVRVGAMVLVEVSG